MSFVPLVQVPETLQHISGKELQVVYQQGQAEERLTFGPRAEVLPSRFE